jgi:hypothetical protein
MEEPSKEKCRCCRMRDSHPVYNDWCEDCYADIKLTKMYGRKQKDRSVRNSSHAVRNVDLGPSVDPPR